MVGTAHSNNGINVQTITFTGSQMPIYPAIFAALPTGVALPRPTIFTFSTRLPEREGAAGERRVRMGGDARHDLAASHYLRRQRATICRARPT